VDVFLIKLSVEVGVEVVVTEVVPVSVSVIFDVALSVGLALGVLDIRGEDDSVPVIAGVLERPGDAVMVTVLVLVFDCDEDPVTVGDTLDDFDTTALSEPVAEILAVIDPLDDNVYDVVDLGESLTDTVADADCVSV